MRWRCPWCGGPVEGLQVTFETVVAPHVLDKLVDQPQALARAIADGQADVLIDDIGATCLDCRWRGSLWEADAESAWRWQQQRQSFPYDPGSIDAMELPQRIRSRLLRYFTSVAELRAYVDNGSSLQDIWGIGPESERAVLEWLEKPQHSEEEAT